MSNYNNDLVLEQLAEIESLRQIEQQPQQSGGFNPTAEEIAAIRAREMAEAQQSAPSSSQRRERGQSGLGIE